MADGSPTRPEAAQTSGAAGPLDAPRPEAVPRSQAVPAEAAHPKSRGAARRAQRRGPTMEDVAEVAGVSRGTVSRVLNGAFHVSPESLAAVQAAMRETGYVVNQSARSLVTRRSGAIAFVLSEPQDRLFEDPVFGVLLRTCTQVLAEDDRSLVLMLASTPQEQSRVMRFVRGGHVDGVLLVSTHDGDPLAAQLDEAGVPVVVCGRPPAPGLRMPFVAADDRGGARLITQYLLDQGRRRIATVAGPDDTAGGVERLAGYRDVLGRRVPAHGVVRADDFSIAAGHAAMTGLLAGCPSLDAVFVASDLLAVGALEALHEAGRRVPEDVLVGGFDDSAVAAATRPPLTTVRQPLPQVAAEMVEVLMQLIAGRPASSRVLPTTLVRRGSA
ncbi:LacI family DNA-binding transcriptional regulator [Kineosporia sp. J2-2]|uniref:LacI family DNA-binding transcriptional regulator n=1 Tax=Kineosporia corallincola TaxID=2835133 RepID=A0ABS5TS96_9ACTN|nr:LacI family DNA-binding transcriptional regulator [Kineosporia corallincola]MBT0773669.1 LacI family DNA-binding transcriptional regulator [Kineosporia corallincola]